MLGSAGALLVAARGYWHALFSMTDFRQRTKTYMCNTPKPQTHKPQTPKPQTPKPLNPKPASMAEDWDFGFACFLEEQPVSLFFVRTCLAFWV